MMPSLFLIRGNPLDACNHKPYDGEMLYDNIAERCYGYKGGDWVEITNAVDPAHRTDEEEALTCKSCGARLQSIRCEYCGTYSWSAKEFFIE